MLSRFVAIRDGSIFVVSSSPITDDDPAVKVLEVPSEYVHLAPSELVTQLQVRAGRLRPRRTSGPVDRLKLAFIGNWKMQCGISTYSENLLPHVARRFGDFKLFIERNDTPTGPVNMIGDVVVGHDRVIPCWNRGAPLGDLARAVREYDPDIVWIQHEFGIWPNAGHWLSLMNRLDSYRTIVTMHSVFHHLDKTIVEAAMPEIIVHLQGARDVLQSEKGIASPVHVVPHGCEPIAEPERLWNFYHSDRTFMQFGFGFRYKGWEKSIRAAAILRERYPDVFFTGLYSESSFNTADHQLYYESLMREVESLGIQDNVAIIRGYQSDAALDSYMRTNQAIVFPYVSHPQHEVFGASGAARLAMSKGAPVVTTSVNHFSDIPTIKADTPEEIAHALDRMFSNRLARKEQVERQLKFINENSWERVAEKHIQIFAG
jgi:glycosyltransferase involved in cell wall biosynthesis